PPASPEENLLVDTTGLESAKPAWRARWYLWDGGFLTLGRGGPSGGVVPAHAHHAVQVTVGLDGLIGHRKPGEEWTVFGGGMVAPDIEHELDVRGSLIAILFVDPETREGRWLRRSIQAPITGIPEG